MSINSISSLPPLPQMPQQVQNTPKPAAAPTATPPVAMSNDGDSDDAGSGSVNLHA